MCLDMKVDLIIREYVLKNLLKILQTVLIGVLLFFAQGGTTAVHAGGATANFQNYLNTLSAVLSNKVSLTDIANSAASQNSAASTSSATNTYPNYVSPTQASCPSCYNTPEHTGEFFLPVNLSSLPENESLLPAAESYSVTVCLPYNNMTVPGCGEKDNVYEASEKLAVTILSKYSKANKGETRPFKVVMPSSMPPDQQSQALRQIEKEVINIIASGMIMVGDRGMLNAFDEEMKKATRDAENGVNWSKSIKEDRSTYSFHIGEALDKLNRIIISARQIQ